MKYSSIIILIVALGALGVWYFQGASFPLPSGETTVFVDQEENENEEQDAVEGVETLTSASDSTQIQSVPSADTQEENGVSIEADTTQTESIQARQPQEEETKTRRQI